MNECNHVWEPHKNAIIKCKICNSDILDFIIEQGRENADLREKLKFSDANYKKAVLIAKKKKDQRYDLSAKIGKLDKYAELGRLILNRNPCYFGYEYADGDCVSVVCSDNEKKVCKLRAELLAGEKYD